MTDYACLVSTLRTQVQLFHVVENFNLIAPAADKKSGKAKTVTTTTMAAFAHALAARLAALLQCTACEDGQSDGFFLCGCCPGCPECRAKSEGVCRAEAASGERCTHSALFFRQLRELPRKLTTCAFCGLEGVDASATSPYGPAHVCPKVPCRAPGCQGLGAGPHHEATCEVFKDACKAALRGWIKIRHYLCDGEINPSADPHRMEGMQDGAALPDLGNLPEVDFEQAAAAADSLLESTPAPAPERKQVGSGSGKRPRAIAFDDVEDYSDDKDNDSGADTESEMRLTLPKNLKAKPLKKKVKRDPSYQPGVKLPAGVTTHRS